MIPIYVEPFLGAGATWLRLLCPSLVPLVSWMGGKRRDADDHLALLGLRPRDIVPAVLGDASWWGWVWPAVLDPEDGPRISSTLRRWRTEDPRALWFRLRDLGPLEDRAEAAAQLLWLQARAASGVPVWWEGELMSMDGRGYGPYRAGQSTGRPRLLQEASTQVDDAGQRQARDPRLIQMAGGRGPYEASMSGDKALLLAFDGRNDARVAGQRTTRTERLLSHGGGAGETYEAGAKGAIGAGGIVDPGTIAARADAIRARLLGGDIAGGSREACAKGTSRDGAGGIVDPGTIAARLAISHMDAIVFTESLASVIGRRGRVYLDPPYQGATGYPVTCSRENVLAIADTWARHGARVVLSEAVGLAGDLGPGWEAIRLRASPKPEWVTIHGCDARAVLPPLLRVLRGGGA